MMDSDKQKERERSARRRLLLTSLEQIPTQDELEEEEEQSTEVDDEETKQKSLQQFVSLVKKVQAEKASMEEILGHEDSELLRQLFVSYVVSREKLFDKGKIISGLVDGAFRESATKENIFKALHALEREKVRPSDWNGHFQLLLAKKDSMEKCTRLSNLAQSFVETAERYGRIIIEESYLPYHAKTIKPVSIGGRAGGEKYKCAGILFKFAVDPGMYHGTLNAMKAAGHELKGLNAYLNSNIPDLYVPLAALIDYKGFRVTAIAWLPIHGKKSIIYGSANRGKKICMKNELCNKRMRQAAEKLGLAEHEVREVNKSTVFTIAAPLDIEVHEGDDDKFYIVDAARVFPPEQFHCQNFPQTVWFQLLRPEFLASCRASGIYLSSDVYSGFVKESSDKKQHQDEIARQTKRLLEEVIPQYAKELKDKLVNTEFIPDEEKQVHIVTADIFFSLKKKLAASNEEELVIDGTQTFRRFSLAAHMHGNGINMRHLGRVRSHITDRGLKVLLLSEMVARVAKQILRERLRKHRNEIDDSDEQIVLNLLNEMIGNNYVPERPLPQVRTNLKPPEPTLGDTGYETEDQFIEEVESEEAMRRRLMKRETENYVEVLEKGIPPFWSQRWKIDVLDNKFKYALTEEEKEWDYNLIKEVDLKMLVSRFCAMCGIVLAPGVMQQFSERTFRRFRSNLKESDNKKKEKPKKPAAVNIGRAKMGARKNTGPLRKGKGSDQKKSKSKKKEDKRTNIKTSGKATANALSRLLQGSSAHVKNEPASDSTDDSSSSSSDEQETSAGTTSRFMALMNKAKRSSAGGKKGDDEEKGNKSDDDKEDNNSAEEEEGEERESEQDEEESNDDDEEEKEKENQKEREDKSNQEKESSENQRGIRWEFVEGDIEIIKPMVKHLNVVDFSKGYALYFAARSKRGSTQVRERMRLLDLAAEKFEMALVTAPTNHLAIHRLGCVFALQAKTNAGGDEKSQEEAIKLFTKAIETFNDCAKLTNDYSPVFLELIKALTLQLLLKVGKDSSKNETKEVLSLLGQHARRITFIYADEIKSPPQISRQLGASDSEHEAERIMDDLYDFLTRLFKRAVQKTPHEEISSAGFDSQLQKNKKRTGRKELSLVVILVTCDSIHQNTNTPAATRRKFFHLWADTMVHHYRKLSHKKEDILLREYIELSKSKTIRINTDRYYSMMECFSMIVTNFTKQLLLFTQQPSSDKVDLRQPQTSVRRVNGDTTPTIRHMVKNCLDRAAKLEALPQAKPHQISLYLYVYAVYSAIRNIIEQTTSEDIKATEEEKQYWNQKELDEMKFKVTMGLGHALFAISKGQSLSEILFSLSHAAAEFESSLGMKEDALDAFILNIFSSKMKHDLSHLLWMASHSPKLTERIHHLITSSSAAALKEEGSRYPLVAKLDFSQTYTPTKILTSFLQRYKSDIVSLDFSHCKHFTGESLLRTYSSGKEAATPTEDLPPALRSLNVSYTITNEAAIDAVMDNSPQLEHLIAEGCPSLLRQPAVLQHHPEQQTTQKKVSESPRRATPPQPGLRSALRSTPLRPGLEPKKESNTKEGGKRKRSRRELEEQEHQARRELEETLRKEAAPSKLRELDVRLYTRKVKVLADTMLKRKIESGAPIVLSPEWMVELGNLQRLAVHRLTDLEMLNSISRNCPNLRDFQVEDFGTVEISMYNIGQFCQTFTNLLGQLQSLAIGNISDFACDSWAFTQWCIDKKRSFPLKKLHLTFMEKEDFTQRMELFFRFFKESLEEFTLKRASVTIPGMREIFSSHNLKRLFLKKVKICYIAEKTVNRESGPPTHVRNRGWEKFIATIVGEKSENVPGFSPEVRKSLRFGSDHPGLSKARSEKNIVNSDKCIPAKAVKSGSVIHLARGLAMKKPTVSFEDSDDDSSEDETNQKKQKKEEDKAKHSEESTTENEDDDDEDDDDEEDEGMGKLDKMLPNIQSFTLSHSKIEETAYLMTLVLRLPSSLQELSFAGCTNISDKMLTSICKHFTSLTVLDLSYSNISEMSGSTIALRCKTIQKIKVARCQRLKSAFLASLQPLISLRELSLKGCKDIDDFGVSFLSKCQNLEMLDLSECNKVTGVSLENLCKLKHLKRVHFNGTGRVWPEAVTKFVRRSPALKWLDMQKMLIVDPPLCAFIQHCCPNLEVLDVRGCNVKDQSTLDNSAAKGRLIDDF